MENPRDIARASWGEAQKVRSDILGKIASLKKERGNINYTTRFEEVEQTMAEFRLACMQVIFHDFEYAVDKKVEHSLWQAHTFLNNEYRKVVGRLMAQSQVVQRRKLDKLYRAFLKTSESFYRVYIQRLSARFYIPELRQAACGTELESTESSTDDVSPPAPLRAMVLKSCQTTLVRLGDLARYRCHISEKLSKATFDKALDYYGLANTLDPDDGSAHHQTAVLYQLQGQHLDIVYHFHRAISIAKPHELALGNLEREFRGLENSSHSKKGPVKDPSEAMITWFVRLHAFFFQGEQFSQQTELEKEVLHRMEIAMKSDSSEAVLRKMILINIAAYDVASEKVKASWTMTGSQSCQFLLRFNVCTILTLLRALKNAMRDGPTTDPDSGNEGDDSEGVLMFNPDIMKLLPLLRIYISWIYVTRADLVQYQDYLEPFVRDVYRLLADTITLLNTYIDETKTVSPSKYLLPEDTEALGLRSLCDRKLPLFLQVDGHQGPNPSKRQKIRKPRQIVFGRQFKPQTEAVWRIRDIVYCGVFLAGSAKFPLALTVENKDGHDLERWVFTDETATPVYSDELGMARILAKLSLGDLKTAPEIPIQKEISLVPVEGISGQPIQPPPNPLDDIVPSPVVQVNKGKSLEKPQGTFLESDLSKDNEMMNMVDSLVGPEDSRTQTSQAHGETNYGMDSSTANEIFGRLDASPAQPSPVSRAIPSLPWDYFYTPTPHRSNSQGQNQMNPSNDYVPRSAAAQLDGFDSSSYLDHLDTPYQQAANGSFVPNAQPQIRRGSRVDAVHQSNGLPSAFNNNSTLGSLETSRNAVLDSLNSALRAQHGFAPSKAAPSETLPARTPWSPTRGPRSSSGMSSSSFPIAVGSPKLGDIKNPAVSTFMERSGSQRAAANMQSPIGPPGQGQLGGGEAAPAGPFSKTVSPVINNFEFQRTYGQGRLSIGAREDIPSAPFQQQYSSWLQEHPSTSNSSLAFSSSSSLYGGTPIAAAAGGPAHTVASNGNFFNASTPYGRLGEGMNNRDDPTHFRNQLKAATGSSQLSYDQQILQAALLDSTRNKQRPK
ncbi:hypothetical protein F5X96DRAFT_393497 [Biscogniauxia mediterranea]|nr:hypothetical protein F5X96DRAFT_393497 [Biscogniauxia mediterranea]